AEALAEALHAPPFLVDADQHRPRCRRADRGTQVHHLGPRTEVALEQDHARAGIVLQPLALLRGEFHAGNADHEHPSVSIASAVAHGRHCRRWPGGRRGTGGPFAFPPEPVAGNAFFTNPGLDGAPLPARAPRTRGMHRPWPAVSPAPRRSTAHTGAKPARGCSSAVRRSPPALPRRAWRTLRRRARVR